MKLIQDRAELVELARELGVRADWHEPDEARLTARVEGETFDNAGFWPTADAMRLFNRMDTTSVEMHVILYRETDECDECSAGEREPVAAINLATLLAWACGTAQ
jgi:hypothetical protein